MSSSFLLWLGFVLYTASQWLLRFQTHVCGFKQQTLQTLAWTYKQWLNSFIEPTKWSQPQHCTQPLRFALGALHFLLQFLLLPVLVPQRRLHVFQLWRHLEMVSMLLCRSNRSEYIHMCRHAYTCVLMCTHEYNVELYNKFIYNYI